jgi:hypothetical protein
VEVASFRIPVAVDARGKLVAPDAAKPRARYACPGCGSIVDLHAGERKRRHFHHRAASCSSESALHACAKRWIAERIRAWLDATESAPIVVRRCGAAGCRAEARQRIPRKVIDVAVERALPSGHVADVLLLGPAGLPVASIEVLHTHAVDATKARETGMPWIEVSAKQVCADAGAVLVPVRDRFVPWFCAEHGATRGAARRDEIGERARRGALVRALPYRLEDFPGYRIDRIAVCPRGHDTLVLGWDGRTPPWPRPEHVVACAEESDVRYDRAVGRSRKTLPFRRRYVSVCVRCGDRIDAE